MQAQAQTVRMMEVHWVMQLKVYTLSFAFRCCFSSVSNSFLCLCFRDSCFVNLVGKRNKDSIFCVYIQEGHNILKHLVLSHQCLLAHQCRVPKGTRLVSVLVVVTFVVLTNHSSVFVWIATNEKPHKLS